jgi:hypothetical protein
LAFLLKPELCFVNVTDKNIILQSEQEIATVEEAQVLCAETELKAPKPRVSKKTNLASSFEYQMFPAKVSRHSSINGKGKAYLTVTEFKAR